MKFVWSTFNEAFVNPDHVILIETTGDNSWRAILSTGLVLDLDKDAVEGIIQEKIED